GLKPRCNPTFGPGIRSASRVFLSLAVSPNDGAITDLCLPGTRNSHENYKSLLPHPAQLPDFVFVGRGWTRTRFHAGPNTTHGLEQLEPFCMRRERRSGACTGGRNGCDRDEVRGLYVHPDR